MTSPTQQVKGFFADINSVSFPKAVWKVIQIAAVLPSENVCGQNIKLVSSKLWESSGWHIDVGLSNSQASYP